MESIFGMRLYDKIYWQNFEIILDHLSKNYFAVDLFYEAIGKSFLFFIDDVDLELILLIFK